MKDKVLVDTDFIIAYLRENDRLHEEAEKIFKQYENLYASPYVFLELGLVVTDWSENIEKIFSNIMEFIEPTKDEKIILRAAYYMNQYDLTIFDAFHCSYANNQPIISSDKKFDQTKTERIKLE